MNEQHEYVWINSYDSLWVISCFEDCNVIMKCLVEYIREYGELWIIVDFLDDLKLKYHITHQSDENLDIFSLIIT